MEAAFFWIFSSLSVLSALSILFVKKPTRALLGLLGSMICLSVLYTLLQAYFVAVVHIIVYAGAILVLFLFVIMLEGLGALTLPISKRFSRCHLALTTLLGLGFTAFIIKIISQAGAPDLKPIEGTVEKVGHDLFTTYLLPFELISVLILIGIFAAVSLVKPSKEKP